MIPDELPPDVVAVARELLGGVAQRELLFLAERSPAIWDSLWSAIEALAEIRKQHPDARAMVINPVLPRRPLPSEMLRWLDHYKRGRIEYEVTFLGGRAPISIKLRPIGTKVRPKRRAGARPHPVTVEQVVSAKARYPKLGYKRLAEMLMNETKPTKKITPAIVSARLKEAVAKNRKEIPPR